MDKHRPATKVAEGMLTAASGATMAEIIRETGGPQYNVLKKLQALGYAIKRVKEGRETRYFAESPGPPLFEAKVTSQGQVTIPKEMRERLGLHEGQKVRFTLERGNRVVLAPATFRLKDLFGILGKPRRNLTLEEMDETVREAAVERYSRAVGRRKR